MKDISIKGNFDEHLIEAMIFGLLSYGFDKIDIDMNEGLFAIKAYRMSNNKKTEEQDAISGD